MHEKGIVYSFSDGKYWSKYNHCRVWKNGSYTVKVKDQYDNTVSHNIDIVNYVGREVPCPIIEGKAMLYHGYEVDYKSGHWVSASHITLTNTRVDGKTMYSTNLITWQELTHHKVEITGDKNGEHHYFKNVDQYGNESIVVGFTIRNTSLPPHNIGYIPKKLVTGGIKTEVNVIEDRAFPLKYTISYDGGHTWSPKQYGKYFLLKDVQPGLYRIRCRVYNDADIYVEGPVVDMIFH